MITYEIASKIAYDTIQKTVFDGIGKAYDMGECYLFVADDPDVVYYTCRTLIVSKMDGSVRWYTYKDAQENEDNEKRKKELNVLEEFLYKKA